MAAYRLLHRWGNAPTAARINWSRLVVSRMLQAWFDRQLSEHYGAYIAVTANIPTSVTFMHELHGLFIAEAEIGERCVFHHRVTIGAVARPSGRAVPRIGNDVFIGADVTLIGACVIGDGAKIGAGVTLTDAIIEPGAVIVNKSAYDLTNKRFIYPQD